jgi:hypothetical protein
MLAAVLQQARYPGSEGRERRAKLLERVLSGERRLARSALGARLVAVAPGASDEEGELRRTRLTDVLSLRAVRDGSSGLAGEISGLIWALMPVVTEEQLTTAVRQAGLLDARIAVSQPLTADTDVSYVREQLAVVLAVPDGQPVTFLADLGAALPLAVIGHAVRDLLPAEENLALRIREHDLEKGTDYEASLRTWLNLGGDMAAAAQVVHLHPNSLRYRLTRAGRLFDLRLDDPDSRLLLHLQLRLLELAPPT